MFGNDDVMEFMNLTSKQTGIDGVIFLSTTTGQHGPRVRYFVKAGRNQPSFSVSITAEPGILANSPPQRVLSRVGPSVVEWVKLNRAALLKFWNEGESWSIDELASFADHHARVDTPSP